MKVSIDLPDIDKMTEQQQMSSGLTLWYLIAFVVIAMVPSRRLAPGTNGPINTEDRVFVTFVKLWLLVLSPMIFPMMVVLTFLYYAMTSSSKSK